MKKIFYFIFTIFIAIWFFLYPNVYSEDEINNIKVIWKDIFLDSDSLNNTIIWIKSTIDIRDYYFIWSCNSKTDFIWVKDNIYYFNLTINQKNCEKVNYYLRNNKKTYFDKVIEVNYITDFELLSKYLDLKTEDLIKLKNDKKANIKKLSLEWNLDISEIFDIFLSNKANLYHISMIDDIIEKRKLKYTIPVYGRKLPVLRHKLPNAPRPYRASYTYWIHEWWDIDTEFWEEVIAIDDWIIIRTVEWFLFEDLWKIVKWNNLSHTQKLLNLDILRWNQIWLKTMKWDVVFYGHLEDVYENIKPWVIVKRWQPLWTVGISWIPDKNYKDYHLHFELRKNPMDKSKAWNNTYLDYMNRDWYFNDKSIDYIRQNQYEIFSKF